MVFLHWIFKSSSFLDGPAPFYISVPVPVPVDSAASTGCLASAAGVVATVAGVGVDAEE